MIFLWLAMGCSGADEDKDGFSIADDCDDGDAAVNPGVAEEPYDGVDNDCDAATPDDDLDGDGAIGDADCDDLDAAVGPEAAEVWYDGVDNDCDAATVDDDQDGDGVGVGEDCNDEEAAIQPGAEEVCNGADDDCDGAVDEEVQVTLFVDADGDGYGDPGNTVLGCGPGGGKVDNEEDCDDSEASAYPGAPEIPYDDIDNDCDPATDDDDADGDGFLLDADCDDADAASFPGGVEVCDEADNNCDGTVDEGVTTTFHADADSDGYGSVSANVEACSVPVGYTTGAEDCDDGRASVYPGAPEVCNGGDDDCDGTVDDGVLLAFYADVDGDGFGDAADAVQTCAAPAGYVADSTDCDDLHAEALPGGSEVCDGLDNDCSGAADEGLTSVWYADRDGDGAGDAGAPVDACGQPADHVASATDCNDADATVYPGAPEVCDGQDNDCGGAVDEGVEQTFYVDADGDGSGELSQQIAACLAPAGYADTDDDCDDADAAVYPGAPEVCADGAVNDCGSSIAAALAVCPAWPGTLSGADWTITGEQADAALGIAVAAFDSDGDGDDDPVLGSERYDLGGQNAVGAVYLPRRYASASISTLTPTRLIGEDSDGYAGSALATPGDLTGDGNPDVAVGAWAALDTGAVYLRSGPFSAGSVGLWLSPAIRYGGSGSEFGTSLAGAGDSDGDGVADLLVGAPGEGSDAGAVYLLSGTFTGTSTATGGMSGVSVGDRAGASVAAGDVDGDGLADLLIGAPGADSFTGRASLLFGGGSATLSAPDLEIAGDGLEAAGSVVAFAGDTDADGYGDLLVGTASDSVYLFRGGGLSGSLLTTDADTTLSDADISGAQIAGEGDVDGDAYADLLISSTAPTNGAVWLLRGPLSAGTQTMAAATQRVDGSVAAEVTISVAFGDLDGDGWDDALVGSWAGAGAVYVLLTDGY